METAGAPPITATPDPRDLLQAARGGDAEAGAEFIRPRLQELYALHFGYAILRGRGPDHARAGAAAGVGRTLPALVTRLRRFRANRALEPWIWRIGLNVAFTRDTAGGGDLLPGEAAAFLLHVHFALEVDAVAAVLGVAPERVGPRIGRARRRLRERDGEGTATAPCPQFSESIDALLADALLGNERSRVTTHLAACAACRAEVESLRAVDERFAAVVRGALPSAEEVQVWADASAVLWRGTDPIWSVDPRLEARARRHRIVGRLRAFALALALVSLVIWMGRC